jgi:hypothetical protein
MSSVGLYAGWRGIKMIVSCASCNRHLGTIAGKLISGWVMLCSNCESKRKAAEWLRGNKGDGSIPDFLTDLFKKKG